MVMGRWRTQANETPIAITIKQQMGLELELGWFVFPMVIGMGWRKQSYTLGHQRMGRRFVDR